jgi:hypothetical protein
VRGRRLTAWAMTRPFWVGYQNEHMHSVWHPASKHILRAFTADSGSSLTSHYYSALNSVWELQSSVIIAIIRQT